MPYRPQGNSVLERMHLTLHIMLSMYSNILQNNRAELLPFIQLTHNTYVNTTMHETQFFSFFERQARLPIDAIPSFPHIGRSATTEKFAHFPQENLQIAFGLASRNLSGQKINKNGCHLQIPPIPKFFPGQSVLVYKLHQSTDGPNPKLIQPW